MGWGKNYMDNERKKITDKLIKRLQSKLWINLIIGILVLILFFIVLIIVYDQFREGTEKLWVVIMCVGFFVMVLLLLTIDTKPFFKDMKLVKMDKFQTITGKVIKYRRVVHGGDPDTVNYYPTIRDINKEWVEVEVKADDTELNKIYHCVYLPNTKLAVCEELLNSEEISKTIV